MPDRRQCRCRPSGITVPQNDDLVVACRDLSRENGGVVSLGAAVRKKRFLEPARRDLGELFSQVALRPVSIKRRRVSDRVDLVFPRLIDLRVGMPDAHRQHTAKAIEITIALVIPDVFALAFDHGQRLLVIGGNGRKKKFLMLVGSLWQALIFVLLESYFPSYKMDES